MNETGIHDLTKPAAGELPQCDDEVYRNGETVAVITGASARLIDRFVREVADLSGEKVDWHYIGGRGRVATTGDAGKVRETMRRLQLHINYVE